MSFIADLLFPKICYGCGRLGSYICQNCQSKLIFVEIQVCPYCKKNSYLGLTHPGCRREGGVDGLFSFYRYTPLASKIIKSIKYRLTTAAIDDFFNIIAAPKLHQLSEFAHLTDNPLLIPVPLHPSRQARRGFNQSEEFAKRLSELTQIKIDSTSVKRVKNTKPQAQLSQKDRYNNTRGAFAASDSLTGHDCLIVDDVWSSGFTIKEIAKTIKKSNKTHVYAISMAR